MEYEYAVLDDAAIDDAQALFASDASAGQPLRSPEEVSAAIAVGRARHATDGGCGCFVAAEYGDHPDLAPDRMRWAIDVVAHGPDCPHASA